MSKTDSRDIREIDEITFGIYSSEEIRELSVCKVDSSKICSTDKNTGYSTVYDPRMGTIENGKLCETCGGTAWNCPGHFGHIDLNEPVVHPLHYKRVVDFLRCFCIKCFKLLITNDQVMLNNFNRLTGVKRFNKILEKLEKIDMCYHCSQPQPDIKYTSSDNSISMIYKQKEKEKSKISILLQVEEIKNIFENISIEDVKLMGFNPDLMHPKNLILSAFPVIPICARPYIVSESNICDDDLTIQIVEIVKANNHLKIEDGVPISENKRQKYLQSLKFRIATFYNNTSGKARHSTNGRAIKGLKERLTGKEGLIRTNLLGKRCDYTGRTVIGPDPTLKLGQLAIPHEMANNLTIPVQVTNYNFEYLTKIVNEGKANFVIKKDNGSRINLEHKLFFRGTMLEHGDVVIRTDPKTGKETELVITNGKDTLKPGDRLKRNGEFITDIKYPEKRAYHLNIGDIVERRLMNGDILLLNRQPTLHEGSMMAQEIVIHKGKTLRFNLSIAKSFNADFDGDEMNIHIPQTVEAQTELKLISASKFKIISAQGSKPNFCIVQDSLLGAHRMTLGNQPLKKHQFYDITLKLGYELDKILKKIQHIRRVLKEKGKKVQCFNGKGLISLVLPDDLFYEKKNNADPNEPTIRIYKGVLYEGAIDKSVVGATANSLIQIINKEYGPDETANFIDGVQFMSNNWLLISGFSVGLEDCIVKGDEQTEKIKDVIEKCYIEAEGIKTTSTHAGIREVRITGTLSKAKDIGLKIAKESLDPNNNFLSTVRSGSKGDYFNVAQITGLLGQQNLLGKRVCPTLNNGKRTLPHYPMEQTDVNMEYESRGFIENSFIKGLNPRQFYFHCMSGREGCADTAMNTATSGYIQRRIVKLTEDIKVNYDNTTRDTIGSIYQIAYGENGVNPTTTIKVESEQQICDISSIVNKLNIKHQDKLKSKK